MVTAGIDRTESTTEEATDVTAEQTGVAAGAQGLLPNHQGGAIHQGGGIGAPGPAPITLDDPGRFQGPKEGEVQGPGGHIGVKLPASNPRREA